MATFFCYCPLVGILFEVLIIERDKYLYQVVNYFLWCKQSGDCLPSLQTSHCRCVVIPPKCYTQNSPPEKQNVKYTAFHKYQERKGKERKGKVPCLPSVKGFSLKLVFQPGRAPHIMIVTGPPTVPGQDLNPEPLSFQNKCSPDWANKARRMLISLFFLSFLYNYILSVYYYTQICN